MRLYFIFSRTPHNKCLYVRGLIRVVHLSHDGGIIHQCTLQLTFLLTTCMSNTQTGRRTLPYDQDKRQAPRAATAHGGECTQKHTRQRQTTATTVHIQSIIYVSLSTYHSLGLSCQSSGIYLQPRNSTTPAGVLQLKLTYIPTPLLSTPTHTQHMPRNM